MKKTLIICSIVLVALGVSLVVYIVLAQSLSKPIQNNVANTEAKKTVINIIQDEAVEFRNDQGQLVKTISLKPETSAVGKDTMGEKIKITEKYNTAYSKNNKYLGLRRLSYARYKRGDRVWLPEYETSVEYYNSEGKLLWSKAGAITFSISDDGSRVAVVVPLLSEKAKLGRYDDPEMEDPEYREQLVVTDSLGKDLFTYIARQFSGVGMTTEGKYGFVELFSLDEPNKANTLFFNTINKDIYILPNKERKKYYTIDLDDNGNIIFTVLPKDTINCKRIMVAKGVISYSLIVGDTVRIIKSGAWQ
jgi:hypothetical protein